MTRKEISKLKVGDRIKVRALHYRVGYRTVVRVIRQIDESLGVGVNMFGWTPFWLKDNEILEKV